MMKKSIIYIDYLCSKGHKNFNESYLFALSDFGYNINLFTKESYFNSFEHKNNIVFHLIPDRFLRTHKYWIIKLIWRIKLLLFLRNKSKELNCEFVFFSYFEFLPHLIIRFKKKKTFLVLHNNSKYLLYFFGRSLIRRIAKKQTYLVALDYNLGQLLADLSIRNVLTLSHGLPLYPIKNDTQVFMIENVLLKRLKIDIDGKILLYFPNFDRARSYIKWQIFTSKTQTLLKEKNLYLLLKSDNISFQSESIGVIPKLISSNDHNLIFLNSILILDYDEKLKYRASAIVNECILNNVAFFTNVVKKEYSNVCKYNPYYRDLDDLIDCIIDLVGEMESKNKSHDLYKKSSAQNIEIVKLANC